MSGSRSKRNHRREARTRAEALKNLLTRFSRARQESFCSLDTDLACRMTALDKRSVIRKQSGAVSQIPSRYPVRQLPEGAGFVRNPPRRPAAHIRIFQRLFTAKDSTTEILHSPETSLSDACIPGIARFWSRGAQTLAEPFQTVGDGQLGDEFHALVAELAGQSQAERAAVAYGKFTAIHPIGEKSLRMQCIGHIDAFPPVGIDREIDNVSGLWADPHDVQDVGERHADPL